MRYALIALTLSVTAFGFSRKAPAPVPSPVASASPSPAPSPLPTPGSLNGARFTFVSGNATERAQLPRVEAKVNAVIQSQCFKDFMLKWGLIWTNDQTPAQVVAHLQSTNKTAKVEYYYSSKNVLGYTYPNGDTLYFNRRYHMYFTDCEAAANAAHEWSHKLGYDHPYSSTSTRGRTVPYAIGHAFDGCCK